MMQRSGLRAKVLRALLTVLFLALGIAGMISAVHDVQSARTTLQHIQAACQLLFALTSFGTVPLLWRPSRPLIWSVVAWAVGFTLAGALAPTAWGEQPPVTILWMLPLAALISAGVAWLTLWAANATIVSRPPRETSRSSR